MRVGAFASFTPVRALGSAGTAAPLLDPAEAAVALGWDAGELVAPIVPSARTLFGPRGVCLHPDGSLWVSDTGHHRVLGWRRVPARDNAPADILLGQPDFAREGRNARGAPDAATLNVPTGICAWGNGLAVADAWNHRVLLWRRPPERSGTPADLVLGQIDMAGGLANHGADRPGAGTLHWPYGVAAFGDWLAVADAGNRRVLLWHAPDRDGQDAALVLGQPSFHSRDENAGAGVSAVGMRWPHGIALYDGRLAVADAGNNRVTLWAGLPVANGEPCTAVLGQADMTSCDHNMGAYYPTGAALNMPYGLAVAGGRLIVADTANSRLLGFAGVPVGTANAAPAAAGWLAGQPDLGAKGDNAWGPPHRGSLCWPYGIDARSGLVAIADSGNNRVLLWPLAPEAPAA